MKENNKKIALFEINTFNKGTIQTMIDNICENVTNGYEDANVLDLKLKAIEDIVKGSRENLKGKILEYYTTNKDVNKLMGVDISIRNGYETLDYSKDVEYAELEEKLKARKELLTTAYKMKMKDQELVVDGELVPLVPVKSVVNDSVVYKFSK